jgi:hypothetical protein
LFEDDLLVRGPCIVTGRHVVSVDTTDPCGGVVRTVQLVLDRAPRPEGDRYGGEMPFAEG